MTETTRTIEVGGVKIDVDLRHAERHETMRVGDKVKLLVKEGKFESGGDNVYPGAIVGFEPFKDRPTIIVTYLKTEHSKTSVEYAYINSESEKYDIVLAVDDDLPMTKADIVDKLDATIFKAEAELQTARALKASFLRHFGRWFEDKDKEQTA